MMIPPVLVLAMLLSSGIAAAGKFPNPVGHVNDFAGVLSTDTERKLENLLRGLKEKTGAEVAVVTVEDMGGLDELSYAVGLVEEWGIGSKERDDGLLLLIAVKERRMRIEVGYGLEHIITDARAGQIRDRFIVPYLRNDDYDTGVTQGVLAIASIIAEEKGVALEGLLPSGERPAPPRRKPGGPAPFVNLVVMMIIVFFLLSGRRGGRGLLAGMILGSMMGGGRGRYYGGGFGGGFGGGIGGGGGFGGFGGGFSGGGGASGGF